MKRKQSPRELLARYPARTERRRTQGCGFWRAEVNRVHCRFPTCWCYPAWLKSQRKEVAVVSEEILHYAYGEQPPMPEDTIYAIDPLDLLVEAWYVAHEKPGVRPDVTRIVVIDYTNWKGNRRERPIIPMALHWGTNHHYHKEPQWLLRAACIEDWHSIPVKEFALCNIHGARTYRPVKVDEVDRFNRIVEGSINT